MSRVNPVPAPTPTERWLSATQAIHWRNLPFMVLAVLGAFLMALPFLWMVSTSFRTPAEAYKLPPSLLPSRLDFSAYDHVLTSSVPFLTMYWNSFKIALLTTAGVLLNCSMAAFAFSRLNFRGRETLFSILLLGLMVPAGLVVIPVYLGLSRLHLLDTGAALVLPALASSFGVFMLRQFMLGQPRELEEAAAVDGAGQWTVFTRISLPQLAPALSALGIITFTASWNNYMGPLIFLKSWDKMTLPIGISILQGFLGSGSLAVVMAAVTMAILPLLVVFLIAQRYIIEGLAMSGVKG
ncbi:carbohydrate ABC transporter permease (plasmid) [Deinococcus metallilatus]|uniref:Carbohydrate ABC transporter permease n=1 Tax=Deinococcus metallilatus TaxID=1211322 RepID=A0AAJ5F7V7_9DEIO|nr:carbohydrate ABC transporter permease [Deinococcus metallilatus]MBB5293457.1 multiple sugar transport system permease protein [Deinococcus metallilatus]QBY06543.1 carbohydrate ABC transporter permease [Deinococcus metallilatus]RXJ17886.1 carbohydrate ABC transporter permease [Deinococcus metallilatus]TLK32158.1 carbohydrate ABC transporter permease [Deinococcus metallilatus]GMA15323.1 sugar ABC transporter permease [Deinococcus metallilatus]